MGLFPEIPIIPAFPEIPENSPKKATPFNNTHLPKPHNRISWEKGLDLALTRKLTDGTYYAYFPFASLTEESKMTPYHKKLMDEVLQRLHNITRVKNYSLGLGKDIEEEHIGR